MLLLWFILIVNVRPLSVCLLLTVQFIYDSFVASCWERAVLLAFHLCCFYFSAVLIVGLLFPFGVYGRMWNLIIAFLSTSQRPRIASHGTVWLCFATVRGSCGPCTGA